MYGDCMYLENRGNLIQYVYTKKIKKKDDMKPKEKKQEIKKKRLM